jgi:hypothetical protein
LVVPELVPEPLLEPVDDPVEPLPMLPLVLGLGLVVLGLVVLGLVLLEVPPAPALERLSRRHLSRSAPVRPTHLLGTSVDAPVAALSRPTVPVPALLGLPLAPLLAPTAGRSLGPVVLVPPLVLLEPLLPALAPLEPDAPPELDPPPEDWAKVAVESARSAAAVAAVRVFNIMV